MEKNLSSALQDPRTSAQEAPPVSRIQTAMRKILIPMLLGGAVGVAAVPLPAEGKEDPNITALRTRMTKLIADLDHQEFRVREMADRELRKIASAWIQREKKPFPLVELFHPKSGSSLEQQQRLRGIDALQEDEELKLLWQPTIFREPPEWKGRTEAPRVREVLHALEKQAGQGLSWMRPKDFDDGAVTGKLDGRTCFEVLERVCLSEGRNLGLYRSYDGSLAPYLDHDGVYAMEGSVLGRTGQRYQSAVGLSREINMDFLTEDRVLLGDVYINKAVGVTDKGRAVHLHENRIIDNIGDIRSPGPERRITVPLEDEETQMDLTVTTFLHGYEAQVQTVKDLAKTATFHVGSYEFHVSSLQKSEFGYWYIGATFLGDGCVYDRQCLLNVMRCRGFDAKGGPVKMGYCQFDFPSEVQWRFYEQPHAIEIVLPGRSTISEKTFVFKCIPLFNKIDAPSP